MLSRRIRYKVYDVLSTNNAVVRRRRWCGFGGGFHANNIPESLTVTWRNSLFFLLHPLCCTLTQPQFPPPSDIILSTRIYFNVNSHKSHFNCTKHIRVYLFAYHDILSKIMRMKKQCRLDYYSRNRFCFRLFCFNFNTVLKGHHRNSTDLPV